MKKRTMLLSAGLAIMLFAVVPAWAATITLDSVYHPELFQSQSLYVGGTIGGSSFQADWGVSPLLRFDLAAAGLPIGPTTVIDSAVYSSGTGYGFIGNQATGGLESSDVTAYLLAKPWTNAVTWGTYDGTNAWDAPGATGAGDTLATSSTVVNFPGTPAGNWGVRFSLDLTVPVQAWANGSAANDGVILPYTSATAPDFYASWVDSQAPSPGFGWDADKPMLVITYHIADTPEPATMALLAVGGIGMLIRRRRAA